MAKQFALKVTLLNADGSVDASGTICDWSLGGGDSHPEEFTPQGATTSWTTIHVARGSLSDC
jgi:hypothetical protein